MQPRNTVRTRKTKDVFPEDQEFEMHAAIARLCVLYEDLRIEAYGAGGRSIDRLDHLGAGYRQLYFLRRCVVSLVEFSSGLTNLNQSNAFKPIQQRFPHERRNQWDAAIQFFETNRAALKDIRNDIGGHFKLDAARQGIRDIPRSPER